MKIKIAKPSTSPKNQSKSASVVQTDEKNATSTRHTLSRDKINQLVSDNIRKKLYESKFTQSRKKNRISATLNYVDKNRDYCINGEELKVKSGQLHNETSVNKKMNDLKILILNLKKEDLLS